MKLGIQQVLKVLSALFAAAMAVGAAKAEESIEPEIRHLYDPSLYEVESITVFLDFGHPPDEMEQQVRDVLFPRLLSGYFSEKLARKNKEIPIHFGPIPGYCRRSNVSSYEVFSEPTAQGKGNLYVEITVGDYLLKSELGPRVTLTPCIEGLGRVRQIFPVSWEMINPKAPIRLGDCKELGGGWYREPPELVAHNIICKIQPNLDGFFGALKAEGENQ